MSEISETLEQMNLWDTSTFTSSPESAVSLWASNGQTSLSQSEYLQAVSPARISQSQESEQVSRENVQGYGVRCAVSFATYDQISSSWKTFQLSLMEELIEYSETWPKAGMMRNGRCYQQHSLEPRTYDDEFLLLPTPAAQPTGWKHIEVVDKHGNPPTHHNQRFYDKKTGRLVQRGLEQIVKMFPTPTASCIDIDTMERQRFSRTYLKRLKAEGRPYQTQSSGVLNPAWTEWLMGYPVAWTDLEPSEMP